MAYSNILHPGISLSPSSAASHIIVPVRGKTTAAFPLIESVVTGKLLFQTGKEVFLALHEGSFLLFLRAIDFSSQTKFCFIFSITQLPCLK